MAKLESIMCPKCGDLIQSDNFTPNSKGGAPPATSFGTCLRRCDNCGIGCSNSQNPNSIVKICRDPLNNIPPEVHIGALKTVTKALNRINKENKLKKFVFETSEDAVTWTVFKYIAQRGILYESLIQTGVDWLIATDMEPTMLLWGVPVTAADQRGVNIRNRLITVLNKLREDPEKYSEPDVILDFGDIGVVAIEVKYRSPNDKLNEKSPKWAKYMVNSRAFSDIVAVQKTGYYELTRNWRIAWDLADGRSMALINLGPDAIFQGDGGQKIQKFSKCLCQDKTHKFIGRTWTRFFEGIYDHPKWFNNYLKERSLTV